MSKKNKIAFFCLALSALFFIVLIDSYITARFVGGFTCYVESQHVRVGWDDFDGRIFTARYLRMAYTFLFAGGLALAAIGLYFWKRQSTRIEKDAL